MPKLPTWLPYILPLAIFLILTQFEMKYGIAAYPGLYGIKIAVVAGILVGFTRKSKFPEVMPNVKFIPLALVLGVALCALWVAVDRITPHFAFLGSRSGFNPFTAIPNPLARDWFLGVRFIGLVIIAPWMEELFYRSFLLRFVIDPQDFTSVPIGKYELVSCIFAVLVMAAGHPEWLAAGVFSLVMNLMIYRTKSIWACILTHAMTNLALGTYVIYAGAWQYW